MELEYQRQPDGRDGETLIHECCSDLAVSETRAIEILSWAEEKFTVPVHSVSSPAQYIVSMEKFARCMMSFRNAWLGNRLLLYSLNSPAMDDVLNHQSPSDFCRQAGCTRQNGNILLKQIQTELGLPARNGQRTVESRQKMSQKRKAQLK